jgi:TPR repeat protein
MDRRIGRLAAVFTGLAMLASLSGCAAAAIQGATRASDNARILANEDAAARGDVSAQMKMGDSHCCTIAGSAGVLNNQKATEWYCKAAKQGEPRAFYELGRIYSGDLVRGMNAPAKAAAFLTTQRENRPLALMWFNLAVDNNYSDAVGEIGGLRKNMSEAEILEARQAKQDWQNQPCEWNRVYPDNQL